MRGAGRPYSTMTFPWAILWERLALRITPRTEDRLLVTADAASASASPRAGL